MPKPKLVVDKQELQDAINLVESEQEFEGITDLFKAVAQTDWAKNHKPKPVSHSVAYSRYKEFGLDSKTQPARVHTPKEDKQVDNEEIGTSPVVREGVFTTVPSGECPVPFSLFEESIVYTWIDDLQQTWKEQHGDMLSAEAVAYYVNDHTEYDKIREAILTWFDCAGIEVSDEEQQYF